MPRLISFRLVASCALALAVVLLATTVAMAKGIPADLRVIGSGGKVLAEESLTTGTTAVPTSAKATCLGAGTGGSGKTATVPGATALGLLGQAAKQTPALQPLLITDHFDFGLGLCGVGGAVGSEKTGLSWYLKVNHVDPEIGGDSVKLHAGDEVLWALAPYPYPDELALQAPGKATAGKPFEVRVFSYADDGKRSPAAGVTVTGASGPTGAEGRAEVTLRRPARLIARHGKDIPSNRAAVCVGGKCPRG
ncbi:MAG: hypothetical protein WBM00_02375 [Solirubrobacterales bacterium]